MRDLRRNNVDKKVTEAFTENQLAIRNVEGQIAVKVKEFQDQLATLKQQDVELRQKIMAAMEKGDIKKFENEHLTITYIAATNRMGVDLGKLKEEEPEVYKKYLKTSPIKASIRLKIKGESV